MGRSFLAFHVSEDLVRPATEGKSARSLISFLHFFFRDYLSCRFSRVLIRAGPLSYLFRDRLIGLPRGSEDGRQRHPFLKYLYSLKQAVKPLPISLSFLSPFWCCSIVII